MDWKKLIKIKDEVSKALETARAKKDIGLALEAKVILYSEGQEYEFLKQNEGILKDIFIVSAVEIVENRRNKEEEVGLGVKVEKAPGQKCERCWTYSETVGEDKENPTICKKCSENLK